MGWPSSPRRSSSDPCTGSESATCWQCRAARWPSTAQSVCATSCAAREPCCSEQHWNPQQHQHRCTTRAGTVCVVGGHLCRWRSRAGTICVVEGHVQGQSVSLEVTCRNRLRRWRSRAGTICVVEGHMQEPSASLEVCVVGGHVQEPACCWHNLNRQGPPPDATQAAYALFDCNG